MSDEVNVKELGEASELPTDDFVRQVIGQLFASDNDTTNLRCSMDNDDGTKSDVEFQIRLIAINGIKTGDGDAS